jgi:hypothetical protein
MGDRGKPVSERRPTRPAEDAPSASRTPSDLPGKDHAADKPGHRQLGGILRELEEQQRHLD